MIAYLETFLRHCVLDVQICVDNCNALCYKLLHENNNEYIPTGLAG